MDQIYKLQKNKLFTSFNKLIGSVLVLFILASLLLLPSGSRAIINLENSNVESNLPEYLENSRGLDLVNTDYNEHGVISVNGNADLINQAAAEGWDLGGTRDGTIDKPFVISNYNITASNSILIEIVWTDLHLEITNNFLKGNVSISSIGIDIQRVKNIRINHNYFQDFGLSAIQVYYGSEITIDHNEVSKSERGIRLMYSLDNLIEENIIVDSSEYGLVSYSSNSTIYHSNSIINSYVAISLTNSNQNNITRNKIEYSGPVKLVDSSHDNLVKYNKISNILWLSGVYIDHSLRNKVVSNSIWSENDTLSVYSIWISSSNFSLVRGNNISMHNILVQSSEEVIVGANRLNSGYIQLSKSNLSIVFLNQVVTSSLGIYMDSNSSYNKISFNSINKTTTDPGFSMYEYDGIDNQYTYNYLSNTPKIDADLDGISDDPVLVGNNNYDPLPLVNHVNSSLPLMINSTTFAQVNTHISGNITLNWNTTGRLGVVPDLYTIHYREIGSSDWLNLVTNTTASSYLWNSLYFQDGIYELRIVAHYLNYNFTTIYNLNHTIQIENYGKFITVPTIQLPSSGTTLFDTVIISWTYSSTNLTETIYYSIYYSPDSAGTWHPIAEDIQTLIYYWDTSSVEDGENYIIKVQAHDSSRLYISESIVESLIVDNEVLKAPEITYPNGGDTLSGKQEIYWIPSESLYNDPLQVSLYYSSNGGNNWNLIVSGLDKNVNSYLWDTSNLFDSNQYLVKIYVEDQHGNTVEDVSDEMFSVSNGNATDYGNTSTGLLPVDILISLSSIFILIPFFSKKDLLDDFS